MISAFVFASALVQAKTHQASESSNSRFEKVDESKITTPQIAIEELRKGNVRFTSRKMLKQNFIEQVKEGAHGQHPYAAIVSCLDSRVPPELVFDQGLGDIFVARVAGNVINPDILGSLEFATQVKGSKLVLVLGHTSCGAVAGACQDVKLGSLTQLLTKINPSVDKIKKEKSAGFDPKNESHIDQVSRENVLAQVAAIEAQSPIIAGLVKDGKVQVIGAMYDIATGKVEFYTGNRGLSSVGY